ncbi:MAG: response regulator, partial [Sphingobacteriales bacterium]
MNKHILIIDDNQDLLTMMTALLKNRGYAVTVNDNADDIVEVIKKIQPDIIMMDMLLSGADGREKCREIKADPSIAGIPLVMLSAYPQAVTDCMAAGADGFI